MTVRATELQPHTTMREWASAQTLLAILEQSPLPTLLFDVRWQIVFANDAAALMLHYERGELERGYTLDDIIPEQLRARYRQLRDESLRERGPGAPFLKGERIGRTKEGNELLVELAVSRVESEGREFKIATFVDISGQRQLEQETIGRLHSILEHAEVGIFLIQVDEDGSFIFESFNPVTEKLTGVKSEQARGRKPDEVVPPEEAQRICANYQRCVDLGLPITYEESPGPVVGGKSFRTTLVPIRNRAGRVHRIIGMAHDITGQKQAELALASTQKSLKESEDRFRKVFAVSPHPIGITELSSGALVEVNEAFERVFGHTRQQALGKTTTELGMWRDPAARQRMLELLRDLGSFSNLEIRGADRAGRPLSLLLSGALIDIDGLRRLVTYVNDVTDHRAFQAALARSEERFKKAFLASPEAFAIIDGPSGRLLEVNDGFVRLFGRTRSEVIGRSSVELDLWVDPLERERARQILVRERTLRDFELLGNTATGETRDCLISAELLDFESGWCIVVSVRDVTEARRADRLRAELERQLRQTQKLDALGTLAGGIAHDFNNILGAMLAFTELIQLDITEPHHIAQHLVELKRAGERAANLVRQILTFSRKQHQSRKPLQLEATVREALGLVRAGLPATIGLDVNLDARSTVVLADATALHQVVMNLCTNAAHAMRSRQGVLGVRLDAIASDATLVSTHPGLQLGRYARLSVSDTGEGMTPDVLKRVFEPFFTTKGPGQGTGLGMAVAHGIVRDHEGVIVLESTPGSGTVVTVFLPEYEAGLRASLPPETALPRGRGERILLVDDEQVLCTSVGGLLGRLGYQVEAFTDSRKALQRFREDAGSFALVLSDLTMPGMTGIDLAREIHATTPLKPIVIMSGFGGDHSQESLLALGVRDLLAKPLSAGRIAECVRARIDEALRSST